MFGYRRFLPDLAHKNKIMFAVVAIVVVVLVIDTSLIKTSILTTSESGSATRINFFITILSVIVVAQFIILAFVRQETRDIRRKKELHIHAINTIVTISQAVLTVLLLFIILQIVITSQYNIDLAIAALAISHLLAIITLVLLTQRFFSWLKSNRNPIILFYGLASAILAINIATALLFVDLTLSSNQPQNIVPHLGENIPFLIPASDLSILYATNDITSIISFMMMWIATCMLLRHYSRKMGKIKFWILVSIPLVYFLSQFLTLSLNLFGPLLSSQSIFYGVLLTLVFTLSKSAGGILFGIAFWTAIRNIHESSVVRNYMIISAYGLVLLFTSNQANVLVTAPYPPFGLAAASFIGLASYMLLVGIYSSAISVSHDIKLRQSIRKLAVKESKLLDSIGSAHMEQEIERRVISMTKENEDILANETGIEPSLSETEVKEYLREVIEEVRKGKVQNGDK